MVGTVESRMNLWQKQIEELLAEFADLEYLERAWRGLIPGEIHTFEESFEMLFGDTNLGEALSEGTVYSAEVDSELRELHALLRTVDHVRNVEEVLSDTAMSRIRPVAAKALLLMTNHLSGLPAG